MQECVKLKFYNYRKITEKLDNTNYMRIEILKFYGFEFILVVISKFSVSINKILDDKIRK